MNDKSKRNKVWTYITEHSTLIVFGFLIVLLGILRWFLNWPSNNKESEVLIGILVLGFFVIFFVSIRKEEKKSHKKLWPFKPGQTIIFVFVLLIGLLVINSILRTISNWPSDNAESIVLIGIFILSLLPIALAIMDIIIQRGGKIGFKDFTLDFSKVQQKGKPEFVIPANLGSRGNNAREDNLMETLKELQKAVGSDFVVIDLENGDAWWETRLLVLLSGLVRLKKAKAVVFIGTEVKKEQCFLGWGYPEELLNTLLAVNKVYKDSFENARKQSKQMNQTSDTKNGNEEHVKNNKLSDKLLEEKELLNILKQNVEQKNEDLGKIITIFRLDALFESVLNKEYIDLNWPKDKQIDAFLLENDKLLIAVTKRSKYLFLVSRIALLNEFLKNLNEDIDEDKVENKNQNNQ